LCIVRNEMSTESSTGLAKFLLMVKNTKGRATALILQQVLDNPNIYVYGEILDLPNVKALAEGENKQYYETLALFAYVTYSDFKADPKKFLELSAPQSKKLKQLSLVSVAENQKSIPYEVLLKQLDVQNVHESEDLIIDSIYSGVITGKLDQKEQRFQVDWAMGRDIRPGQIEEMIEVLNQWCERSEKLLSSMQDKVQMASILYDQDKARQKEFEDKVENIKSNIKAAMAADMVATDYDGASEHFGFEPQKGARRGKGGGGKRK